MSSTTDVIHRWYHDIWINGHWDRLDTIYRPAPSEECLIPGGTADRNEARETATALTSLVTDHKLCILHTLEQGDWVSALVEMTGLKAGTDIPVQLRWLTLSRIANGRIVESYPQVDLLSFFEQLGQLPPHSFELMLGGAELR